jgi:hypothetical protein
MDLDSLGSNLHAAELDCRRVDHETGYANRRPWSKRGNQFRKRVFGRRLTVGDLREATRIPKDYKLHALLIANGKHEPREPYARSDMFAQSPGGNARWLQG